MAKDQQIQMPGVFGGLMRYNDEYSSNLRMKPIHIIIFILAFALAVIALKIFFPIASNVPTNAGNVPLPSHGFFWSLLK